MLFDFKRFHLSSGRFPHTTDGLDGFFRILFEGTEDDFVILEQISDGGFYTAFLPSGDRMGWNESVDGFSKNFASR